MTNKLPAHFRSSIFLFVFMALFSISHSTLAAGAPTYTQINNLEDADPGAEWGSYALRGAEAFSGGNSSAQGTDANNAAEGLIGGIAFLNLTDGPAEGAGGLAIYVNDSDITNLTIGGDPYTEGTLLTEFDKTKAVAGTDFCFNYGGSADVTCITLSKSSNSEAISSSASQTTSSNTSPVANAGPDQTVASAASVTLDGTGSTDPDTGDTLTYAWTQTDSSGQTVILSDAAAAQPAFTAPTLGANDAAVTLTFSLVVTDDKSNASTADTVDITVNPPAPTPASEFEGAEAKIREVVTDEAVRSLQSTISANRRMTSDARERFVQSIQTADQNDGLVSRNDIAFDVDGTFALNGTTLSTSGEFFEQTGNYDGTQRRLFFGDFDIQHDANTDSTTATITARVAWERLVSEQTMLGYFVGVELAHSTINGTFVGDQDRLGLTVGGYAVHQLQDDLFLDGFLTLGAGRNDLEMANDVLALTSDYNTRTATIGAALSGVYPHDQYEFRPELAFNYGKSWIGNVGFTGRAYGLVDDTLSLDAGSVSIANLTLRPEVVWALDGDTVADSNSQFSFAPRLICERRETVGRTKDCGGGAELGLSSTSEDGLSNVEFRVVMDRVAETTRSSFAFNLEHRF